MQSITEDNSGLTESSQQLDEVVSFFITPDNSKIMHLQDDLIKWTQWKQNRKMWTCNQLDIELLESWPTMPKKFTK